MYLKIPSEGPRSHAEAASRAGDAVAAGDAADRGDAAAAGDPVVPSRPASAGREGGVVRLAAGVREAIDEAARDHYPHEACGLLIGRLPPAEGEPTRVARVAPARNLAVDRLADRYLLDPEDFLAADEAARRDRLDIIGIWHSHPDHPARPSRTDLEAAWPGYTYLIVSVNASGVPDRRAWRLHDGDFIEQRIIEQRVIEERAIEPRFQE